MNTEIRLVKCPKCRKVLPEPNIPVYKCGGCGAILQAKKLKTSINGNVLRAQETNLSSVSSSSSSAGGDHDHPSVESSPGSDPRGETFESKSHKSVMPVDVDTADDHSHSPELNYLEDDEMPPEVSVVQGERECLLDQDASNNGSKKPHVRTSDELSDSCDNYHEKEGSSAKISIPGKKHEEGYSLKLNVATCVKEIEDSHGLLEEEGIFSGKPKSLDPYRTHLSASKNLMDEEKEWQNIGTFRNEIDGSHGVLEKEESCSDDPETTPSVNIEPLKLVEDIEQNNMANEVGNCRNDTEDFQGELFQEGKPSNEIQSFDGPGTHLPANERLKMDEENKPPLEHEEHSKVDELRYISRENDRMRQNGSPDQVVEYSQKSETAKETASLSETPLLVAEEYSIADENSRDNLEKSLGTEKSKEITSAQGPLTKSIVFSPLSLDEYTKECNEVGPSFHRASSDEMSDTFPINPRVPIGSMSKSLTRIYYAGDESESSAQVSHQYSRKVKGTGTTSTNRSRQKDGISVKNKHNGELQMHNERLDLSSKFKQTDTFSSAQQDWRRAESTEPRKLSHPIRSSIVAGNDEPISRGPNMPRNSQLLHRNGTPANSTEFQRPDTMLHSDPEKSELLRMVHDLEDKIKRTDMSKQTSGEILPSRVVGEEIRSGGYYDGPTSRRNPYVDFKYPGHPQTKGWANQPRSSKMSFSGEASLCRNHIDCRCSHCYHQGLHFSPKLSSRCIHCQHAAHPRHDYDNIYHSYTPSPQHYTSSQFSHEIRPGNQKQNHDMKMPYSRDKHQVTKRHLRSFCGGAPIIGCYHCSELLQLPADFLLFRRRCHQLRCVSCNRIMKVSLLDKSHLVPYVINIQAPPPRIHSSTSHANDPQGAGPVSFSDDFEPYLSRNGSIASLPSVPSSHSLLKNLSKGKQPSNQIFQATNYRRMRTFMEIYQDTNNNSSFNIEPAGPSHSTSTRMKPSSEIEEQPANLNSRLHRLMGYESPGQVLFAKSEDESEDGMGYYMDQHIL